ncbi:hypothetical protein KAI78_10170 [bacterium]|nr:hypothetical protein [bacterium]MCK5599979.1 hypothetical protein [bacterium]
MRTKIFFTALFLSIVVFMLVETFFCFAVLTRENNPSAQFHHPSVVDITEMKPSIPIRLNMNRNPFLLPAKYKGSADSEMPLFDYALSAISKVNGKMNAMFKQNKTGLTISVSEGDTLTDWLIIHIGQDHVILEKEGFRKKLSVW